VFIVNGLEPLVLVQRLHGLLVVQNMEFLSVGETTTDPHTDRLSYEWRTGFVEELMDL
jgi:hypothetical protein